MIPPTSPHQLYPSLVFSMSATYWGALTRVEKHHLILVVLSFTALSHICPAHLILLSVYSESSMPFWYSLLEVGLASNFNQIFCLKMKGIKWHSGVQTSKLLIKGQISILLIRLNRWKNLKLVCFSPLCGQSAQRFALQGCYIPHGWIWTGYCWWKGACSGSSSLDSLSALAHQWV